MRLPAALFALAALFTTSAQAEGLIEVLDAGAPRPLAPSASSCARAAPGGDIECTLNLGPARSAAEARVSERIVIRTQWSAPCPSRGAQVLTLGPATRTTSRRATEALPVVEQANPRSACAS